MYGFDEGAHSTPDLHEAYFETEHGFQRNDCTNPYIPPRQVNPDLFSSSQSEHCGASWEWEREHVPGHAPKRMSKRRSFYHPEPIIEEPSSEESSPEKNCDHLLGMDPPPFPQF